MSGEHWHLLRHVKNFQIALNSNKLLPLVFITGASSGIGQALAWHFYQSGYRLALAARRTEDIKIWAKTKGLDAARYSVYSADVVSTKSIVAAAHLCIAQNGVPDIVIANAGISIGMDTAIFEDIEVLANTFQTNNIGMAATFHPFISRMVHRNSGTLVGIGSVAGIRGLPGHGAYCASKAAVISYCESLRGELRPYGLKVVTICPGYIDTPLTKENRYSMPFLMHPRDFAKRAFSAITVGAAYSVIPWQMGIVAKILKVLPIFLFDKILSGRQRKLRKP